MEKRIVAGYLRVCQKNLSAVQGINALSRQQNSIYEVYAPCAYFREYVSHDTPLEERTIWKEAVDYCRLKDISIAIENCGVLSSDPNTVVSMIQYAIDRYVSVYDATEGIDVCALSTKVPKGYENAMICRYVSFYAEDNGQEEKCSHKGIKKTAVKKKKVVETLAKVEKEDKHLNALLSIAEFAIRVRELEYQLRGVGMTPCRSRIAKFNSVGGTE